VPKTTTAGKSYRNDQQDVTVQDNLLPHCSLIAQTCFERYYRSSSEASKL